MGLIRSAAHFSACGCKRHGRVIWADGSESVELVALDQAEEVLSSALAGGIALEVEFGELRRQIRKANLLLKLPQVEGRRNPIFLRVLADWESQKSESEDPQGVPLEDFHEFVLEVVNNIQQQVVSFPESLQRLFEAEDDSWGEPDGQPRQ